MSFQCVHKPESHVGRGQMQPANEAGEGPGTLLPQSAVSVSWRGRPVEIPVQLPSSTTIGDLMALLYEKTGVRMENQKLVSRGKALSDTSVQLATIGLPVKLVLIGSTDEAVEAATTVPKLDVRIKDDLTGGGGGLSRRARGVAAQRKYGFGRIEVLPGLSEPEKARAILHELATDPGVLHVLEKHKWQVGALCELYPEGYVGVSDVCVMGLNQNKGQKILLRLRTDDLKGFRKMLSIRKVLYHEMAHNEHSEHDDKFYMLMREIERDVLAYNASGRALGGAARYTGGGEAAVPVDGYRLGGSSTELQQLFSARELAGLAAQQRITEEERHIEEGCGCRGPAHARAGDAQSPVISLGEQHREVTQLSPPPASSEDQAVQPGEDPLSVPTLPTSPPSAAEPPVSAPEASERDASPSVGVRAEDVQVDVMDIDGGLGSEAPGSPPRNGFWELIAMGFEEAQAQRALDFFHGEVDQAADYLLNHDGRSDGLAATPAWPTSDAVDPLSREGRVMDSARRIHQDLPDPLARQAAIDTLLSMIKNILEHPAEEKYRRVRVTNAKFYAAVGRHLAALDFLRALGFEELNGNLELKRNDPGLLWLGKSTLQQ